MANSIRTPTAPVGVHTFTLPSLPHEQGRHFALVTRTKDWRLLLVRADLSEQEKGDGTLQEDQLVDNISGFWGCEQLDHGEGWSWEWDREDGRDMILLDEVDLLHNKTPYQNALIEQGLLIDAGKRTKWPPTDEKVKAVINKATQGCCDEDGVVRRFALGEEEALRASIAAAEARPPEDPSTWNDGLRRLPYFKLKIPRPRISRQCACCQKLEVDCAPTSARFRVCAACMRVAYCSKECQVSEWKSGGVHGAGECKLLRKGELRDAFTQRWRHHRRLDNYAMLLEEEGLIIDENQEPKESELEFRKAAGDSARFIRCKRKDGQEFLWTD